ncbi:MAG: hypothetical protein VX265_04410 [Myxococcota bacterium]|nr:hypothetical protein [Myxococcota bacterium]
MTLARVHIHIGAPKSGSTAIQRCLAEHRPALADAGFCYPDVSLRGWGHHDLAFLLGGGYPEWATPQPLGLDALAEQLQRSLSPRHHTLILSSEDFYLFPNPAGLRTWLEDVVGSLPTVTVDAYLRSQAALLPSWYNQLVKAQGFSGTFDEAVARDGHLWDYAARLAPWAETFGIPALRVSAYPRTDVRVHYLERLGASHCVTPAPMRRQNRRLIRDVLEFQRVVNRRPGPTVEKRRFHKRLIALSHLEPRPPELRDAPVATPRRLAELAAAYRASNAEVRTRYGVQGRLDEVPQLGPVPDAGSYSGPSAAALALIESWLCAEEP